MLEIRKNRPEDRIIELGGGNARHPISDCNVDARPGPQVDFVANFEEPLPIQSDEWDACLSQFVLEHLSWRKVRGFISEIFRILKPGGRVIIVTANTEAQFEWIKNNPEGWDNQDIFDSASNIIFASQDYEYNYHKNYMSPDIVHKLFQDAGFVDILTQPYGERDTDLCLTALKPLNTPLDLQKGTQQASHRTKPYVCIKDGVILESDNQDGPWTPVENAPVNNPVTLVEKSEIKVSAELIAPAILLPPEELFDREYFNGGKKVGGYAREGYWDYPVHWITARHVLARSPMSVLELGCGRGYLLKRFQDLGISSVGLEVSRHCYLTRVCDDIVRTGFM